MPAVLDKGAIQVLNVVSHWFRLCVAFIRVVVMKAITRNAENIVVST
jgi:hypothetical protein